MLCCTAYMLVKLLATAPCTITGSKRIWNVGLVRPNRWNHAVYVLSQPTFGSAATTHPLLSCLSSLCMRTTIYVEEETLPNRCIRYAVLSTDPQVLHLHTATLVTNEFRNLNIYNWLASGRTPLAPDSMTSELYEVFMSSTAFVVSPSSGVFF